MRDRLIESARPGVGLVVGTFAAVPYVHLQLEAARRFEPGLPLLVHDDSSPHLERLRELAGAYGHRCVSTARRSPPCVGDLSAMAEGARWAEGRGVELLVKLSRRFVPLHAWTAELQRLAHRLQYATYSSACAGFNFGFRTECVAFHVPTWRRSGAFGLIEEKVRNEESVFVEGFVHDLARMVRREAPCEQIERLESFFPRAESVSGYGDWWIGGTSRLARQPDVLWHDCDSPEDYARVAIEWGLPYTVHDFQDPNAGSGAMPEGFS